MSPPEPDQGLALSLSSAFIGFYTHAGFLQGLWDAGVWPSHLAGASSGALVAGLAASGRSPAEILALLLSFRFRTAFFEPGMIAGVPFYPVHARTYSGALTGRRILSYLRELLGDQRIENCTPRLGIAVTNLSRRRAEVRTEGPLAELIVASCAYPTLLSHQVVEGDALWDGGIAHSPPLSHWKDSPAVRHILCHCIGESIIPPAQKLGVSAAFALAHDIIADELYEMRRASLESSGKTVHRITTPARRPAMFVTEKAGRQLFELGQMSGRRAAGLLASPAPLVATS